MHIGHYQLDNNLILAPMAGVTDRPFRELCREQGAGLAVSEMLSSNPRVWNSTKSKLRMDYHDESGIRSVQIAGAEPLEMANAARLTVKLGAQIVDINMGCPAKKVNKKKAGSALLPHPDLVKAILESVVDAVDVPVTLKIRTGWDPESRNGLEIAQIAEQAGIQALTVHGRTRQCLFKGEAEYDTIKTIKENITIPVIANGDITSPQKAQEVLNYTGADGVMVGRGAQGKPWIFKQIQHYLETGETLAPPPLSQQFEILYEHVTNVQGFYGDTAGVRIARKHVGWYLSEHDTDRQFRKTFNAIDDATEQLDALNAYFQALQTRENRQISPAA